MDMSISGNIMLVDGNAVLACVATPLFAGMTGSLERIELARFARATFLSFI
jgi:hypothetical protein